jgi:3-phenylpropionate/trans-cinnamate dioxygenase ferredoxin component
MFMFVRIGNAGDVQGGQMRVFDVSGTKVNVANADGQLYAFDDTCTHMGCSLARGELQGTTVTCACHGSQFDVTSGAVLRGPAQRPVRSRSVQVDGDALLAESWELAPTDKPAVTSETQGTTP